MHRRRFFLKKEGEHDLPLGVGGSKILLVLDVLLDSPGPHLAGTGNEEEASWVGKRR